MRLVIQRVSEASVSIEGEQKSSIEQGLMLLVGIEPQDTSEDIDWLVKKTVNFRIFDDEQGVMNRSVLDIKGGLLVVSQFTLHARTKKGNRPSYVNAAGPDIAIPLYEKFVLRLQEASAVKVGTGEFGANMQVHLINDGPVTIIIDSKQKRIMKLSEAQQEVDRWIKTYGVRYFSELTNMAILTEEVGELARVMARKFGDQSFKKTDLKVDMADEMADVLWVLICLANQTGVDLEDAFAKNMAKKTQRDSTRHLNNDKLK